MPALRHWPRVGDGRLFTFLLPKARYFFAKIYETGTGALKKAWRSFLMEVQPSARSLSTQTPANISSFISTNQMYEPHLLQGLGSWLWRWQSLCLVTQECHQPRVALPCPAGKANSEFPGCTELLSRDHSLEYRVSSCPNRLKSRWVRQACL